MMFRTCIPWLHDEPSAESADLAKILKGLNELKTSVGYLKEDIGLAHDYGLIKQHRDILLEQVERLNSDISALTNARDYLKTQLEESQQQVRNCAEEKATLIINCGIMSEQIKKLEDTLKKTRERLDEESAKYQDLHTKFVQYNAIIDTQDTLINRQAATIDKLKVKTAKNKTTKGKKK